MAETLLDTAAHSWGCVAAFYSAYHTAKWALLRDPRFKDLKALHSIHPLLAPDDRTTQWHKARRGRVHSGFGVNDLMELMYKEVAVDYLLLHSASGDVRYKAPKAWVRLPEGSVILEALDRVESHLTTVILGAEVSGTSRP